MITTTRPRPRLTLHRVSVVTESGHPITDTIAAYDADDAAVKVRSMIRANHGQTRTRILSVTPA